MLIFSSMFDSMSCEANILTEMYQNRYIHHTVMNSDVCVEYGLDFLTIKKKSRRKISLISNQRKKFVLSIFPSVRMAALCNTLAIVHKKIVLNKAKRVYISDDLIINLQTAIPFVDEHISNDSTANLHQGNDTDNSNVPIDNKSMLDLSSYIEPLVSHILPTKTLSSTDEETDSSNKYQIKESATMNNENTTHTLSYVEPNSTNDVTVPSSSQCMHFLKYLYLYNIIYSVYYYNNKYITFFFSYS